MESVKPVEVVGIDLIRFLAASSVVVWHFAGKPFLTPESSTLHPLLPVAQAAIPSGVAFSWFGWVGVQVFFVISGVVIAWSAERSTGTRFFIGRAARLWPAMIICGAICSVLAIIFWDTTISKQGMKYILSVLFYPFGPWYSGQVWTLPIEIAFYAVVWALIVAKRLQWMEAFAWLLAVASMAYWLANGVLAIHIPGRRYLQLFLVLHGCYFALGIVLAKASTQGFTISRIALLTICIITAAIEISERSTEELRGSFYNYNAVVPYGIWLVSVATIWASMKWRNEIGERFANQLVFLKLLGALTYPLYLVHYQTGGPIFAALYKRGWPIWGALVPAFLFALIFALAIVKWGEPVLSDYIKIKLRKLMQRRQRTILS